MVVRLAFSVCVHVDADIVILDEALAVGDARFQFKCHATLDRMIKHGAQLTPEEEQALVDYLAQKY